MASAWFASPSQLGARPALHLSFGRGGGKKEQRGGGKPFPDVVGDDAGAFFPPSSFFLPYRLRRSNFFLKRTYYAKKII
jgi:hypothetical protein